MTTSGETISNEPDPRRWIGLFAALMAPFLGVVDYFVVNLAMPALERELGASFSEQELVIAFYGVAYSVLVVTGGRLGDVHGRKRMFLIGLSAFVATSVVCALAQSPEALLAGRLLQGAAAALVFPQVLALVQVNFPPHERPRALSFFGVAVALASIAGQVAGGWLLVWNPFGLSWRTLFLVNVPLGGVALWVASRTLHEARGEHRPKLDLAGVVLASTALLLLLVPLVRGPEVGFSPALLVMLGASPFAIAAFVALERRTKRTGGDPLVDLRLFELDSFRLGLGVVCAYSFGQGSLFLTLSLVLQRGAALDAADAASVFAPFAVAMLVVSLFAGPRAGRRRKTFLFGGLALVVAGYSTLVVALALLPYEHIPRALQLGLFAYGIGHGAIVPVLYPTLLRSIPLRDAGAASGVLSMTQQVAAMFGLAAIGFLFAHALRASSDPLAEAHAGAIATAINLASGVAALVLALRLPRASFE